MENIYIYMCVCVYIIDLERYLVYGEVFFEKAIM